ncbi:MAG: PilZ domain-containing protein [Myxococcaceae bacterium]|nr:PilZ domain-containing protein [Myxococcaceae bacterium]
MPGKINNRRNVRVFCNVPARVEGPRGPIRGTCRNLSVGGLFFLGGVLPVGKTADFTIELPQGKVQAQGEVRYHYEYPNEGQGMGVKFVRITQEHLEWVTRWVETHEPVPS